MPFYVLYKYMKENFLAALLLFFGKWRYRKQLMKSFYPFSMFFLVILSQTHAVFVPQFPQVFQAEII